MSAIANMKYIQPPPIPGLTFDALTHTYTYNDQVLPSVTQILKPVEDWSFLSDDEKAWYAGRGTAVHVATALDDVGDLAEESVHDEIKGYLASWRALRDSGAFGILSVEERVVHPLLGVAGTLDRRVLISWQKRKVHAVIDLKAGTKQNSHGIQTHGYKLLWNHWTRTAQVTHCFTAYLQKDGAPAKLVEWHDQLHDSMFVALATTHKWRQRYAQ